MKKISTHYKVGEWDKFGKKIVQVADGWYRDEDGKVRDEKGFEWFAHEGSGDARMAPDAVFGQTIVVRDFQIAVKPMSFMEPKDFIKHYQPVIEQTMVETGWDYADVATPITFGETNDGFVHIYVKMKRKSWKNRENAYAGMKTGESNFTKSKALTKEGALNPVIRGVSEVDKEVQKILQKRSI